jgi:predicted DsbA family dithiol-disulfide isomerase
MAAEAVLLTCEIVSDVICPWCFLGHARLSLALVALRACWRDDGGARRRPHLRVEKTWVPFLLMPGLDPNRKVLKRASYLKKFRGDAGKVEAMGAKLRRLFAEVEVEGGAVAYTLDGHLGSSLHAHRVAEIAKDVSPECQTRFVLEVMRRYHEEGLAPSDLENLQEIADACGLGITDMREWIDSGAKLDEVAAALATRPTNFPLMSGVPFFHFSVPDANDGTQVKAVVPGAQDTHTFALVLAKLFRRAGYAPLDLSKLASAHMAHSRV